MSKNYFSTADSSLQTRWNDASNFIFQKQGLVSLHRGSDYCPPKNVRAIYEILVTYLLIPTVEYPIPTSTEYNEHLLVQST